MEGKFVMENRNIEKQISPDEIDAQIHQRILTEERFLKWNIGAATVFAFLFLSVVVVGIFKQNVKAVIIFGIITAICMLAAIGYAEDYRKVKNRKYPCYLCKIENFIDNQYLRVNSDIKAIYSQEDFKDIYVYSEEDDDEEDWEEMQDAGEEDSDRESPKDIEAILINSAGNHWYAFSMNWYKGI